MTKQAARNPALTGCRGVTPLARPRQGSGPFRAAVGANP